MVDLGQLRSFLKAVEFPVSAADLAVVAHAAPTDIRKFISAIDPLEELTSVEDVVQRAEGTNLLVQARQFVPFYETLEHEED